jgi:hypothetical protein
LRIATLVLLLGWPLVVVLAWYHGHKGQQRFSTVELSLLSVMVLIAGGVLWFFGTSPTSKPASLRLRSTSALDSGDALREHERRCEGRVFLGWAFRGVAARLDSHQRAARRSTDVLVLIQGHSRRHPDHRAPTQRGDGIGRQRA